MDSMVCIPLCASILFFLPVGNHTNAISACVSYACITNRKPKYAPPAGHHRVVLSISAPVSKYHCAFHPSAITITVSAGAFQSAQSTRLCVQHSRQQPHSSLRTPPATIRICASYFFTSERKSFLQFAQSPT